MFSFEVVAAVAGAVGACAACVSAYRDLKAKKNIQSLLHQQGKAEALLESGGTVVKKEYDEYYARLGKKPTVDVAQTKPEPSQYGITSRPLVAGPSSLESLPLIPSTPGDSSEGVVTMLGQQCQRISQVGLIKLAFLSQFVGKPIRNLTQSTGYFHVPPVADGKGKVCSSAQSSFIHRDGKYRCHCHSTCGPVPILRSFYIFPAGSEKFGMRILPLLQSHIVDMNGKRLKHGDEIHYCKVCDPGTDMPGQVFDWYHLLLHLSSHSAAELESTFGDDISRCRCAKGRSGCGPDCRAKKFCR